MALAQRRLLILAALGAATAAAQITYQKPSKAILDVLNAPPAPLVSVNPTRTHMLLAQGERYPSIAEVSQPMLRLAGERINPRTNGPHRAPRFVSLALKQLDNGSEIPVRLPAGARPGMPRWSPDGRRFAFLNTADRAIELWVGNAATGAVRRLEGHTVSAAWGEPLQWMPDSRTLLVQGIPAGRGDAPAPPTVPPGPNVQESSGRAGPVRTFQDLLASAADEDLFDYYATCQLALIDAESGRRTPLGKPGVFQSTEASPDGRHLLVVRIHRPYSYLHTAASFPKEVEIWDLGGKLLHSLASLPLADRVPIDGVPAGPRSYQWRPTSPATLVWVEALDGGNPKEKVPHRDRVLMLEAPFSAASKELARTEHRFRGIQWGERAGLALVADYDRNRRWLRTFLLDADQPGSPGRLLWSRNVQDRYGDPGDPVTRTLANGYRAIMQSGDAIYLTGDGASASGERPVLDRLDLKTRKTERLFQSDVNAYETVVGVLDDAGTRLLTRRETPARPANYYLRTPGSGGLTALTKFEDPAPQLRSIRKQLVAYKREDGVQLSFTLYLPPGHKDGTRLPTVVWAYPREFNDADTAGQIGGSTERFTTLTGASHLFFLLEGYAILDGASMPVIGDPETVNNTFLDQIVLSALAAIAKAAEMGVTDPQRVGVGGHSYGGFMTANLLAHSDLFRAGIARSGAYNRTLTPFGFQTERRTLWEARDVYLRMSPFLHADKIREPILFLHGEADNNSGTFPIQSERMYAAVRGHGGTARLVTLPHEAHGYAARESIEHTLHEMTAWFDKHVKNARPVTSGIR